MRDLTVRQLEEYCLIITNNLEQKKGLFVKLVEELEKLAEVLNGRSGRKEGVKDSNEELAKFGDHSLKLAIAAINHIDLTDHFEKRVKAAPSEVSV